MKTRQRLSHLKKIDRILRFSRLIPIGPPWIAQIRRLLENYDAVRIDQHQKLRWTLENEGYRHRAVVDWLWRETRAVEADARAEAGRRLDGDLAATETRPRQNF